MLHTGPLNRRVHKTESKETVPVDSHSTHGVKDSHSVWKSYLSPAPAGPCQANFPHSGATPAKSSRAHYLYGYLYGSAVWKLKS